MQQQQSSPSRRYETDVALIRRNYDIESASRIIAPILEYLSPSYKGASSYRNACQAAEGSAEGNFGVPNCRIRHYAGVTIREVPSFSEYQNAVDQKKKDELRILLRSAGDKGRRAFLDRQPLSAVDTHMLLTVHAPVNKEAEECFSDNKTPVIIHRRDAGRIKGKMYFMHWEPQAKIKNDHVILPLEYRTHRTFSMLSASASSSCSQEWRQEHSEPLQQIPGINPMYELLEAAGESPLLLHPSKELRQVNNDAGGSIHHVPVDCMRWNCSCCYHLMRFDEPIKYAAFFGG